MAAPDMRLFGCGIGGDKPRGRNKYKRIRYTSTRKCGGFLGHFWVTPKMMTRSKTKRNIMISSTKCGEMIYLKTEKYDTAQKNTLS